MLYMRRFQCSRSHCGCLANNGFAFFENPDIAARCSNRSFWKLKFSHNRKSSEGVLSLSQLNEKVSVYTRLFTYINLASFTTPLNTELVVTLYGIGAQGTLGTVLFPFGGSVFNS